MSDSLWRIEGDALRLSMHDGQLRAWDSERRFVFVLAGTQSGKTSWGPLWLWREIQRTARAGETNDYIAATASYDLFKLKMLPTMREFFEQTLGIARYWSGDRILELRDPATGKFLARRAEDPMWGRIVLRSAASGGGLESLTGKAAWLDECGQDEFTVETWEAVLRRLSLARGRALGTTTPYNLGWIKTEIHDKWRAGDGDIDVIQFPSFYNPLFPRAEYERAKAMMPAHRFAMFYDGLLARPAGLIYDCYQDEPREKGGHLVEDFPIPPEWPRYVGVDFGAVNTSLIWVAEDPNRHIFFAYRESLEGGKSSDEHATAALKLAEKENVVRWTGGAPSEDQQRMDWAVGGVPVQRPGVSDVESGIDRVTALFKTFRLFVFRSLIGLRDELGSYKRKLDAAGETTEEIVDKRKFHRLDGLRYDAISMVEGSPEIGPDLWE
jgi:hypothetical protein